MEITRIGIRDAVRPRVGAVVRRVGASTSRFRKLPDMLLVGTQRGGTTSVFRTLRQHPAFVGPIHRKGVHYFDVEYARGSDWYAGHFPLRSSIARRSARIEQEAVVGEASPYYMAHPLAPQRIGAELPGVKIVAVLRDPVERAYSAHTHERARGFEDRDFETAVRLEPSRLAGEIERTIAEPSYQSYSLRHHAYLQRGHYIDQLTRLEQYVGSDRILVLDSHRLFAEPELEFGRLLEFLGLSPYAGLRFERHNARPRIPLADATYADLEKHFAPYDTALAAWLGWTPSWMSDG